MPCGWVGFAPVSAVCAAVICCSHPECSFHWASSPTVSEYDIRCQAAATGRWSCPPPPSLISTRAAGQRWRGTGLDMYRDRGQSVGNGVNCQKWKTVVWFLKTPSQVGVLSCQGHPSSLINGIISAPHVPSLWQEPRGIASIGCLVWPALKPVAFLQRAATLRARLHGLCIKKKSNPPSAKREERLNYLSVFLWRKYYKVSSCKNVIRVYANKNLKGKEESYSFPRSW